ncbi:tryptophan synthase subunit beta [Burkholderia vietnamiensis]|uniref:tryptophan synthase subunit beta n=1 Tax=Burkholderia vietnamiensis TaxID=60552 RepID=UPI00075A7D5A|nr:tryptophan synthase subunit beta [Burkholderia vietnamiensis]TPQ30812.1 tryptophan synthase subunit beta [Burkholderia ubonensis]KVE52971.1 tryptophan synthase subunit beta [Burkholderia vietnamiensis]KVE81972.1 tryptophan synthase subunit beta [Burkholderia vietnamiensis]MDN7924684.1 tryptophan synthase subunit beta [Burkholderia vietnamiensis]HDR9057744.1 tryptophan synthase subunit beta [Burkholderia vietnamiensis]
MPSRFAEVDIPVAATELPNVVGCFGQYGGCFVPEKLRSALDDLCQEYLKVRNDRAFWRALQTDLERYVGRPTPIYHAERLSAINGGAQLLFKREDLNHTGAHKINNSLGQIHLAKRLGKRRVIAETGAGQHGVATATIAARFGLECVVYMGAQDIERQRSNVDRMHVLGAKVVPVTSGSQTLKDALNEALRDWVANVDDTYYVIGSVTGPHPYPMLVRDFQSIIGRESRRQMFSLYGKLPDIVAACVGGGSNAMGIFSEFIPDAAVRMVAVEAGGHGVASGGHAASLCYGCPGVLHGCRTYILQDVDGQLESTHSVSAGLDYPGVGPELSWLKDSGRIDSVSVADKDALEAFHQCSRVEGIIPALESSHAIAWALEQARKMRVDQRILVSLSGRGDKDLALVDDYAQALTA